ncbi:MAG: hypothetical protein ACRDJF_10645 [Actinomycetota bacterium]
MRRRVQAVLGTALITGGLLGLASMGPLSATAQETASRDGNSHSLMHRMMDVMHGEGTAARMHRIQGAEEMIDACARMMKGMGDTMMGAR